ncbi:putative secreted protein (Por secretion system target) [Winogradskyella wandonensis]|uniref:Putative secreted protein (Por secretion system target) n=1 Tax=Winogradskyella wandonensis TaxID=1442586 RepID=A0A4R1KR62_9FLAO|nr:T9SS type A sorting domain-containing protein [Winogradskyella wandonensis]TCK67502.1 putative secreted protein (Por secretion system target) [Winogradskyella wandonensis]
MKKITFLFILFLSLSLIAQQNVTFSVDMSTYGGSFTTVEVNGTFNGFCGNCNPLTDMGGGIWEVTLPLPEGTIEYKYTVNGGAVYEDLTQGAVCSVTNFGFTNRYLEIGPSAIVLDTAPWGGCAEDLVNPGPHNVTFSVDMSGYGGDLSAGVRVIGEWNGFDANSNPLTDQGGGIWSATIPLAEQTWQYKFVVGNYIADEQFTQGAINTSSSSGPCAGGVCTNRFIQVANDLTVQTTWNNSSQTVLSTNSFDNNSFKVFPNPSNTVWNISGLDTTIEKVEVYDILGKSVLSLEPNSQDVSIDASALKTGLYLAKLSSKGSSTTLRLVKN